MSLSRLARTILLSTCIVALSAIVADADTIIDTRAAARPATLTRCSTAQSTPAVVNNSTDIHSIACPAKPQKPHRQRRVQRTNVNQPSVNTPPVKKYDGFNS